MKKYLFLLSLLVLSFQYVYAQTYVTIPDANFRAALKVLYPSCFNANDEMDITCDNIVYLSGLDLKGKNITNLEGIQYFTRLETLYCSDNNISVIENLPSSLQNLSAINNKIETIKFSENLIHIEIDINLLENIPAFPSKLNYFSANGNKIKALPELPSTLKRLFVANNDLLAMPAFPEDMKDINCSGNKLTSIPSLPGFLDMLACGNNFLKNLPPLPQRLDLYAAGNCFTDEYLTSIVFTSSQLLPNRADCNPPRPDNLVVIPDATFRAELIKLYPSCFTISEEMDITCDVVNITSLDLYSKGIVNLEGIQYFTKLETLDCSFNYLSVIKDLPVSLTELVANANRIETIEFTENLIHVELNLNLIESIPSFPLGLNYFTAAGNKIKVLPELPSTLRKLYINFNDLSTMPSLPEAMSDLDCSGNKLTKLPYIPGTIDTLYCTNNFLRSLPEIPAQAFLSASYNCYKDEYLNSIVLNSNQELLPNRLDCSESPENFVTIPDVYFRTFLERKYPTCFNGNNEINYTCPSIVNETSLSLGAANVTDIKGIEYFTHLKHLDINFNWVKTLSNLPAGLTYLDCSYNIIESISELPANLTFLDCSDNYTFQNIPTLPASLTYLDCSSNYYLTNIPTLPEGLEKLDCYICNLNSLPTLPSTLTDLNCYRNKLTTLPVLPSSLVRLDCSDNFLEGFSGISNSISRTALTSLSLPENLSYLNASNNCFESAPVNPNPSVLTTFVVTPNRLDCKTTTSINTQQSSAALAKVYPNPATDKIIIEVRDATSICIYNATGQTMLQKNISTTEELDISSFVPGLYYYTIGDVSGKLIVK